MWSKRIEISRVRNSEIRVKQVKHFGRKNWSRNPNDNTFCWAFILPVFHPSKMSLASTSFVKISLKNMQRFSVSWYANIALFAWFEQPVKQSLNVAILAWLADILLAIKMLCLRSFESILVEHDVSFLNLSSWLWTEPSRMLEMISK